MMIEGRHEEGFSGAHSTQAPLQYKIQSHSILAGTSQI